MHSENQSMCCQGNEGESHLKSALLTPARKILLPQPAVWAAASAGHASLPKISLAETNTTAFRSGPSFVLLVVCQYFLLHLAFSLPSLVFFWVVVVVFFPSYVKHGSWWRMKTRVSLSTYPFLSIVPSLVAFLLRHTIHCCSSLYAYLKLSYVCITLQATGTYCVWSR